jgi:hypothetical protein
MALSNEMKTIQTHLDSTASTLQHTKQQLSLLKRKR